MTPDTAAEEQPQPSFLAKAWRGTKDFVKGTLFALPMTAITSGAALGMSMAASTLTGGLINDPLNVGDEFFGRWIGGSAILAFIGGGMNTYNGWNKSVSSSGTEETKAPAREKEQRALGQSRQHELPGAPPLTPGMDKAHGHARI